MCDINPDNYIDFEDNRFPTEDLQYIFSQNHNLDNIILFQVSLSRFWYNYNYIISYCDIVVSLKLTILSNSYTY